MPVDARQHHVHQHRVEAALRDALCCGLAAADEFRLMTEFGQDGVEHDAAGRERTYCYNPFGRVVLNTILTELGHQAEFIGRGEAAAERIAQGDFDAVLMDMVLPGIDGIEAIRRIRELESAARPHRDHRGIGPRRRRGGVARGRRRRLSGQACESKGSSDCAA